MANEQESQQLNLDLGSDSDSDALIGVDVAKAEVDNA